MSNYVSLQGSFNIPIIGSNDITPTIKIRIETVNYGLFNPIPMKKNIIVDNGEYGFSLLKGGSYVAYVEIIPKSGSNLIKTTMTLYLEVPAVVDDTQNYTLFDFVVNNFSPLLQTNDINYASFLMDSNQYYLMLENNSLIVKDLTNPVQYTAKILDKKGGLLNNNSFEYDLTDELYVFGPIVLSGSANVTTSYNGDIPSSVYLEVEEDTRSLDLTITNDGSSETDIILQHKLPPYSLKPNQQYRLRGYCKLVSGTPTGDIVPILEHTHEELIEFNSIELDETNNGWIYFDSVGTTPDATKLYSSMEVYLKFKMGNIGLLQLRFDEIKLDEYYD